MINNESPSLNQPTTEPFRFPEPPSVPTPVRDTRWWEFFQALLLWVLSIILLAIGSVVLAIPYMVYVQVNGGLLTSEAVVQDKTLVFLSILGVIPAHLVTIFAVWAIYTRWGRIPFWKSLEFTWPRSFTQSQTVLYCAVVSLLLLGVGYVISYFLGGQKTDLERVIESSYAARVVTASLALLTAPLVEEVIYRGLLYPSIEKVAGVIPAIVIVTVLFSGVHVPQYWGNLGVILVITMLSIALTIIRAMSKSLLAPFLIHTIFNGIQSFLLIFEPFFGKPENATPPTTQAIVQFCFSLRHLF